MRTSGAAAKVTNFDRLRKKVRPGTFGKTKVGWLTGVPKKSLSKNEIRKTTKICSDPISADPTRPSPNRPSRRGADRNPPAHRRPRSR